MHPELVEGCMIAALLRFDKLSAHNAELLLGGVRE
jgi:hypothetical protein